MCFGKRKTQLLSLLLVLTAGLSAGVYLHLWTADHDDHAEHHTNTCQLCQQTLLSPKVLLVSAWSDIFNREAIDRAPIEPQTLLVLAERCDPISLRGPPVSDFS
jgi:hypothetical protein